jgi:hypothetical protein
MNHLKKKNRVMQRAKTKKKNLQRNIIFSVMRRAKSLKKNLLEAIIFKEKRRIKFLQKKLQKKLIFSRIVLNEAQKLLLVCLHHYINLIFKNNNKYYQT